MICLQDQHPYVKIGSCNALLTGVDGTLVLGKQPITGLQD